MMQNFNNWEARDLTELLTLLVGKTYGPDVVSQLELIKQTKYFESQNIKKYLELTPQDTVIDLGSGCGFIADALAPDVAHLWCADISKSFLDYAKKVTQKHANVTCQQIEFGKLSGLPQVTAMYSVAVFIHFNLYDCYLYLTQCYNCLESNGRLLFNFLNDKYLDTTASTWQRHTNRYFENRDSLFTNLHYNSDTAIEKIIRQIGFHIEWIKDESPHTFVLLKKI
jgi:cyclopropane fatty-acyl-phospholipid synthase-like methyltransferase